MHHIIFHLGIIRLFAKIKYLIVFFNDPCLHLCMSVAFTLMHLVIVFNINQHLHLRKLIIQYVKQRVVLGPKIQNACWASLPDLPAPPGSCLKRMASLNKNEAFQRALMRLCNILGGWYVKHLEKTQSRSLDDNDRQPLIQSSSGEGLKGNCSNGFAHTQETGFEESCRDDFTEVHIKRAFDEVLRCKHMATLEAQKIAGSIFKGPDINMDSEGYVWSYFLDLCFNFMCYLQDHFRDFC